MRPLRLSVDPLTAWREQMRRALAGEQIPPDQVIPRPAPQLGVRLASSVTRYADSDTPVGGIAIDSWDICDPITGEVVRRWRVVEAHRGRVVYHLVDDDDILDEEYTGEIRVDVLRGLEGRLRRAVADDQGDARHLAALNVIVRLLKNGGES